jgi:AcrR family transcriptional regulator
MKTRQRIVQATLELFNQQGERTVSTNHIAAYMEISPGNLYYHFANKQEIIAELFAEYEQGVDTYLQLPKGVSVGVDDMRFYLQRLFESNWSYRFFYRDLEHLLESDPQLALRYRQFSRRCLRQGQVIFEAFAQAGLLRLHAGQAEALALNAWIILTSWTRFLTTSQAATAQLSEEVVKRGIFQVLTMVSGLVAEPWRAAVNTLFEEFNTPLTLAQE